MEYLHPVLASALMLLFMILSIVFYTKWKKVKKLLARTTEELLSTMEVCRNQKTKIKELELTSSGTQSKPLSMYRRPKTEEEKKSGFDYIFLESFGSYRKAEKSTGIERTTISRSVKRTKFFKHPKMIDTMVVFAPINNQLNSNEK